jgi:hypothetical protein
MRTTIEIDDDVHELVRRRAFEQRRSLGSVISELLKAGLVSQSSQARPRRNLGAFAGLVHVADDFDDTPPEVAAAIEQPLA